MFESGIGAGVRSDRFGTWSLITFLLVFLPISAAFFPIGLGPLAWVPVIACVLTPLSLLPWVIGASTAVSRTKAIRLSPAVRDQLG